MALLRPGTPPPTPLHACLAINTYCTVLGAVVLPLCILYPLERAARRQFQEDAARLAREAAGQSAGLRLAAGAEALPMFPLTGLWLLDFYVYSSLIWAAVAELFSPAGA